MRRPSARGSGGSAEIGIGGSRRRRRARPRSGSPALRFTMRASTWPGPTSTKVSTPWRPSGARCATSTRESAAAPRTPCVAPRRWCERLRGDVRDDRPLRVGERDLADDLRELRGLLAVQRRVARHLHLEADDLALQVARALHGALERGDVAARSQSGCRGCGSRRRRGPRARAWLPRRAARTRLAVEADDRRHADGPVLR